ncbi:U-box domain-containing protein 50 [Dorcoceras hygrometricum]|uniref:U-box domain-containing protein 50 n=1 Tax=Dorcoceras hygrometricum TaxID=472368 RepID=A0A2Z7C810_9LAMI|nr:U-box domain-containing protein 50 [Dorcoceras hygrometricum]
MDFGALQQARIQETEDTIKEQQLTIEALIEEKASLLQTIQGLQEDNGAPFDDEWEEEPEENSEDEGLGEIPVEAMKMKSSRRCNSNNGDEGSSSSRAGLSRENLMAIATIVATTLSHHLLHPYASWDQVLL